MEARTGFEPVVHGFADQCLTTWLPRLIRSPYISTRCDLVYCDFNKTPRVFSPFLHKYMSEVNYVLVLQLLEANLQEV
jgi:hypothetical protein